MTLRFLLNWSGDPKGMNKTFIASTPATGMMGFLDNGQLVMPDFSAIKAALPKRLHASFDRAKSWWWMDKHCPAEPLKMTLLNCKGHFITTLYLQPMTKEQLS